jgi:hypothetical protein
MGDERLHGLPAAKVANAAADVTPRMVGQGHPERDPLKEIRRSH